MPTDVRELLERGAPTPLRDVDVEAVSARGRQWRRRRTATAAAAVAAVVALAVLPLPRLLSPSPTVVFDQPPNASLVGTWVSTDADGGSQTMDITAVDGGGYEVVVDDDAASVCSGASSTMTGTGSLDGAELVVPAPVLECDDGSTPVPLDGSSLEEAVRNYTLVHDAGSDTLTDSMGIQWERPSATPDAGNTEPTTAGPMWPQSSLEEVREAQERADAGDPAYTWQVEPAMGDVGGDAEIFTRFLTEELGWEEFRWSASIYWDLSGGESSVDFVRCAAGELNPMYPKDPDGRGCGPTMGERAYETVRVTAYQPLGDSPDGIWVVRSSQRQPPTHQAVPLSDDEIAQAVEPFLEARVDGKRAGDWGPASIPLLYATSDGARYERFEYEVVDGPTWPFGMVHLNVRLFADGGETVVEQPFKVELDFGSVVTPPPPHRLTMLDYDAGARPTTVNGAPVPEPYDLFDGRVTFAADWSWSDDFIGPHGPDAIGLYRGNEHDQLFAVVGDPLTPTATCDVGDQPPSADAFVRSIRSRPNLSVSAPQPTRVGAIDAVQMDVTAGDEGEGCVVPPGADEQPDEGPAMLAPRPDKNHPERRLWWGVGRNDRARLYVFDVPGNRTRTVAILVMAPKSDFEAVLDAAQPIIDSFALDAK